MVKSKQTESNNMKQNIIDNFKLAINHDKRITREQIIDSELKILLNKLENNNNLNNNDLEKAALLFVLKLSK